MAKKKINTDKSWWAKIPSGIVEAIKIAVDDKTKYINALGFYTAVMIIFCNRKNDEGFIRLSMVKSFLGFGYKTRTKMLEAVIFNKWLFYTKKVAVDKDILIQPVIDVNRMSETRVNSLLQAIRFNDYETLKRLSPNILENKGNSKNLFEGEQNADERVENEEVNEETNKEANKDANKDANGVSNGVPNGAANEVANGVAYGVAYETEQRRARVNKRESKSERENESFNQSKEENRNLLGENETGLLSFSDKKTDYETDSAGTLEEYVNGLQLGSEEVECLFDFAGDEAKFLLSNFDKFKLKFMNRAKLLGKDKELDGQSHNKKNLYLYNTLRKPAFRKELVQDIQDCLKFKVQTEFHIRKEGFRWDFFNKDGDRMSQAKIIPRNAPPRPSPDHYWDFEDNKWIL